MSIDATAAQRDLRYRLPTNGHLEAEQGSQAVEEKMKKCSELHPKQFVGYASSGRTVLTTRDALS